MSYLRKTLTKRNSMMNFVRVITALTVLAFIDECQSFDDKKLVYLSDATGYDEQSLPTAFNNAFNKSKPVVLFVHGRGDEPSKSLRGTGFIAQWWNITGNAVRKLETTYDVTVILFSWDSDRERTWMFWDSSDRRRPLRNSVAGGERLNKVIRALVGAKNNMAKQQRVVLLTHSMGSIVLRNYVQKHGFPEAVFANVILSSADADNLDHKGWVDEIGQRTRVFITINPYDWVLNESTDARPTGAFPLGLDPGNDLSSKASYVDLNVSGKDKKPLEAHEIFYRDKEKWRGYEHVKQFFQKVLSGDQPLFEQGKDIETKWPTRHRLRRAD
jgi:hypothetical protein